MENHSRAGPVERRNLPRPVEEVSVRIPGSEQLHRDSQCPRRGDQRHRNRRQLHSGRADAERCGGLHGREDKGNICTFAADTDPDCLGVVDGNQDFPAAPSGALPLTPKFKATATARYTWPAWADVKAHVQGSVSYRGSAPSSLHLPSSLSAPGKSSTRTSSRAPECRDARRPLRGSGLAELQFRDLHRQPVRQAHRSCRTTACGSCACARRAWPPAYRSAQGRAGSRNLRGVQRAAPFGFDDR